MCGRFEINGLNIVAICYRTVRTCDNVEVMSANMEVKYKVNGVGW